MNKSPFPQSDRPLGGGGVPPRDLAAREGAYQDPYAASLAVPPQDWRQDSVPNVSYSSGGRYGQEDNSGFDFHTILGVMRRRWKLMLVAFLVIVTFQMVRLKQAQPIYEAVSTLEILEIQQSSASDIPGLENILSANRARQVETHIQLLTGSAVHEGAYKRLDEATKAKLQPYKLVQVKQVGDSNLLQIHVEAFDAKAASKLSNALAQEYVDSTLAKNQANSKGAVVYVENQLQDVRSRLIGAQTQLRKFKQTTGVFSVEGQAGLIGERVASLRSELGRAEAQRSGAIAEMEAGKRALAAIPPKRLVAASVANNKIVSDLESDLAELRTQRKILLRDYTEGSEQVKAVDTQISSIQRELGKQPKTVVEQWVPEPMLVPLQTQIAEAEAKANALNAGIVEMRKSLAVAQKEAAKLPDQEYRFVQLATDSEALLQTYQLLNEKLQSLRIGEKVRESDGRMVAAAGDGNQIAPQPSRMIATGLVLGVLVAIALALAWDALDNRIYSEEDAQRATSLPVLAQIPYEKQPDQQILLSVGDRITPLLESFRMLRANIAFSAADRPIRAIVVTSSVPNEGKSSSALNLAAATALGGENVVLIDLDLRRPSQHILAGVPANPGFTNVVSGQATLEDVLQETAIPNLKLLTSGPVPPNPFKLLNSQSARQIISQVIESADFVVIDTPPILGLADARLISTLVDATLLVVSSQETGRREASRAAELLMTTTQDALGIVLTKVPGGLGGYGSYYTYRSYARYFDDDQRSVEMMEDPDMPKKSLSEGKKTHSA